jgi:predicted TIM-barrel fold metal-dependent hydrolase
LLFGRDYYGGDLLQFLETLDLPTAVQERIFFENAARLLCPAER